MPFESASKNIDKPIPLRNPLDPGRRGMKLLQVLAIVGICLCASVTQGAQSVPPSAAGHVTLSLAETQQIVDQATLRGVPWTGPESGPPAQPGKNIAFIAEDLRNGGIVGV